MVAGRRRRHCETWTQNGCPGTEFLHAKREFRLPTADQDYILAGDGLESSLAQLGSRRSGETETILWMAVVEAWFKVGPVCRNLQAEAQTQRAERLHHRRFIKVSPRQQIGVFKATDAIKVDIHDATIQGARRIALGFA